MPNNLKWPTKWEQARTAWERSGQGPIVVDGILAHTHTYDSDLGGIQNSLAGVSPVPVQELQKAARSGGEMTPYQKRLRGIAWVFGKACARCIVAATKEPSTEEQSELARFAVEHARAAARYAIKAHPELVREEIR
jgi:hypothetical protein